MNQTTTPIPSNAGEIDWHPTFRIAVIEGGWVLAGHYSVKDEIVTLERSSVIQRWGTDKGLGQLCLTGPTNDSTIHPTGTAEVNQRAVLFTLKVRREIADKWPC